MLKMLKSKQLVGRKNTASKQKEMLIPLDEPGTFHGMPVGIQIMCRRAEEEVALALAEIVSRVC